LYVRMAYTAVWLCAAGYWGAAFFPDLRKEMLHVTFIGGFSLMIFAVATMVILTHAGAIDILKKPLWILWTVGAALAISLAERFLAVLFADHYFKLLGYSAAWWVAVAVLWLLFMLRYIITVPQVDEFEKMHQVAKNRLKHL
jgi:hypothetical protein